MSDQNVPRTEHLPEVSGCGFERTMPFLIMMAKRTIDSIAKMLWWNLLRRLAAVDSRHRFDRIGVDEAPRIGSGTPLRDLSGRKEVVLRGFQGSRYRQRASHAFSQAFDNE
jgi:hypothetical protein